MAKSSHLREINSSTVLINKGNLGVSKTDELLRKLMGNLIERHHQYVHLPKASFVPTQSSVPCAGRVYDAQDMKSLGEAALDFWLTGGRFEKMFEKELNAFLGTRFCALTNSGSSANLLAVSSLTSPLLKERRLKPGDEVLTVAAGFPTTIAPIIQNGMVPVMVDIELGTYNANVDQLEQAVSSRTKAIILAHTLGNPFNLHRIKLLAQKHGLWLIEDCCDALGSLYQGQCVGTWGDIATFSFYPAHHITMGEGGAVVTNNAVLHKSITSFRDWGRDCYCDTGKDNTCGKRFAWQLGDLPQGYDHKYIYSHLGYNLKLTDMQASVGLSQMKKLKSFIQARRNNWQYLWSHLKDLEEYFILPRPEEFSDPSWFGFILAVRPQAPFTRPEIVSYLEERKIATRMLFAGNITKQPGFQGSNRRLPFELNNTDFIMTNVFWVGVYPGLTHEMLGYVVQEIKNFIKQRTCSLS
ncbi:MAG: lipopolysaccharide biosynthesis protein RfbH [Candidatus Omnitrophica bacterium]|nr:lipopolysaccharide biosynthesis protein RfbH [Candidatus Omnitrophota bacterium]MDE2223227.1 lipopolysaccharide biosynthesis protein RfbH [Candidatus Omnitrophota bacterium]